MYKVGVAKRLLEAARDSGFDRSYIVKYGKVRIGCSQCEALVINGVACHERGCPNQVREREEG